MAFQTLGHSNQAEPGSAEEQLEKLAGDYAKDQNVSFEKTYAAVISTPQGQQLYY